METIDGIANSEVERDGRDEEGRVGMQCHSHLHTQPRAMAAKISGAGC